MLHSGIDLHKRTRTIATVTAEGQPVQDRQLPTTRAAVRAYFAAVPGPHRAVVESTSTWDWLRDLLASEASSSTVATRSPSRRSAMRR